MNPREHVKVKECVQRRPRPLFETMERERGGEEKRRNSGEGGCEVSRHSLEQIRRYNSVEKGEIRLVQESGIRNLAGRRNRGGLKGPEITVGKR